MQMEMLVTGEGTKCTNDKTKCIGYSTSTGVKDIYNNGIVFIQTQLVEKLVLTLLIYMT